MATSGKGTGIVGYNVQVAVDTTSHLIVAHEVANVGHDRGQLSKMGEQAQEATEMAAGIEDPELRESVAKAIKVALARAPHDRPV